MTPGQATPAAPGGMAPGQADSIVRAARAAWEVHYGGPCCLRVCPALDQNGHPMATLYGERAGQVYLWTAARGSTPARLRDWNGEHDVHETPAPGGATTPTQEAP